MIRKWSLLICGGILFTSILGGCGANVASSNTVILEDGEQALVGITTFAYHLEAESTVEGFKAGLESEGYKDGEEVLVDTRDGGANMEYTQEAAASFVRRNYHLMYAIGNNAASSGYDAANEVEMPVIFSSLIEASLAGLVNENGNLLDLTTGVTQGYSVKEHLDLVTELLPSAKQIGFVYTSTDVNTENVVKEYEAYAEELGLTLVTKAITSGSEVIMATIEVADVVDCLISIPDDTVINAMASVVQVANTHNTPIIGSSKEQVQQGCIAGLGVDHYRMGYKAGIMAAEVLNGKNISEIENEVEEEFTTYVNKEAADRLKISIPSSLSNKATSVE